MRLGNLHVTWLSARQTEILRLEVREYLRDAEVKQSIARLARSEAKNYLAELAENAEMPFSSPEAFLSLVRTKLAAALLVERMNSEHSITLDELEERHLEDDPTWKRELDETFGPDNLHIVRGDN